MEFDLTRNYQYGPCKMLKTLKILNIFSKNYSHSSLYLYASNLENELRVRISQLYRRWNSWQWIVNYSIHLFNEQWSIYLFTTFFHSILFASVEKPFFYHLLIRTIICYGIFHCSYIFIDESNVIKVEVEKQAPGSLSSVSHTFASVCTSRVILSNCINH